MKIVTARRISQAFFLLLFLWFCVVTTFGTAWWQLRGWPVNWFLQLDPLVAVGTVLATGTLYAGLAWALVTIALTLLLGRFFCGWVCPFGTMHHAVGYLGSRGKHVSERVARNRYHWAQSIKYVLLIGLLSAAGGALLARLIRSAFDSQVGLWLMAIATIGGAALAVSKLTAFKKTGKRGQTAGILLLLLGGWTFIGLVASMDRMVAASLQTGLLDPIPLVTRSVNLFLLPLADSGPGAIFAGQRLYDGALVIGVIFLAAVLMNLKIPRFYCRFVCPLGALQGVLAGLAPWRIGKAEADCVGCSLCEAHCEGGCESTGNMRLPECVLCMNCVDDCRHGCIGYRSRTSAMGEIASPDLSRRSAVLALAGGVVAVPAMRLEGLTGENWNPALIRPPGSLREPEFLQRCIKCGQCMRVCPTNIIHPGGMELGFESIWTPTLNFRIGTSGCQLNCIACSHVCPTAAIRPISLQEKHGRGDFAQAGPIRLGTAFVDHGRCLPWAMDRPCIVCQENCPVSPKAIIVQEHFSTVRGGVRKVRMADAFTLDVAGDPIRPGQYATGDYFVVIPSEAGGTPRLIVENSDHILRIGPEPFTMVPPVGTVALIQVRLQRPQVDPERCIGCGVCEHECPVSGLRAIRVTAENETRSRKHSLLLR